MKYGLKLFWNGDEPYSPLPFQELNTIVELIKLKGYDAKIYNDRIMFEKIVAEEKKDESKP